MLFPSAAPSVAPSRIAHILKGTAAHRVFQHFPARQETALGQCLLVSFVLCGQCWRYVRSSRIKIYRVETQIEAERESQKTEIALTLPLTGFTTPQNVLDF